MQVQGTVALVTGANRGIGEALVRELLAMGAAKVYAGSRVAGSAVHLVEQGEGRVVEVALDVTQDEQVQQCAQLCHDVSLLINNAGLSRFGRRLIGSADLSGAIAEMDVNYFGPLRMCRAS